MKVIAGDWPENSLVAFKKTVTGKPKELMFQRGLFSYDYLAFDQVDDFAIVTEENRMSVAGKAGWAALGAIALGPLGLIAGAVFGGNKKDRILSVTFKDGRKALLKGDAKDAEILTAATFR